MLPKASHQTKIWEFLLHIFLSYLKNSDGFYDTGIIDTKSRFVHLNKQTEAEVNDRLPVLVVNIPDNMCITESLTHLLSHQVSLSVRPEFSGISVFCVLNR